VATEVKKVTYPSGGIGSAIAGLTENPASTFIIANLHMKETAPYKEAKTAMISRGFVSQVIAQTHDNQVVLSMISQQVIAKEGSLNWLVDLGKICPSIAGKKILIIGVDVASGNKCIVSKGKSQRMDIHVVACVGFMVDVAKKEWKHYCNHYVAYGKKELLTRFDDAGSETETTISSESVKMTAATAVSKHLPSFVQEALEHFGAVDGMIVARGSSSDGEIAAARREETDALKELRVPFAHIAAQRRNNTKLSWKAKEYLRGMTSENFTNIPRGFVTTEGVPSLLGDEAPTEGFYVNGANCTLGQAKQTKFNILHNSGFIKELPELFYALSFMFPNKADGVPYPLPLKCADKYANLFVTLEVSELMTLDPNLKTKLHYI
jgi:hypothetical protein